MISRPFNSRKWFSLRKSSSSPEEGGKDAGKQSQCGSMGLNDEPNTTETQRPLMSNSQAEEAGELWEQESYGSRQKARPPREKPIQFMMRFIISRR